MKNCEICKERPATTQRKFPFSNYLYDVCARCEFDMDKREAVTNGADLKKRDTR